MPNMGSEEEHYQEFKYPYVYPLDDPLDTTHGELLESLTPLENVFVRWMLDVGVASDAIERRVDPRHPFNFVIHSHQTLLRRKTVRDVLKKINSDAPYVQLYKANHMLSVLHGEIQHLRVARRSRRFTGDGVIEEYLAGKKSRQECELMEVEMLLKCLTLAKEITGNVSAPLSESQPSGENRSLDRVLGEAEKLIFGTDAGTGLSPKE